MKTAYSTKPSYDRVLAVSVLFLIIIGLLMVFSASSMVGNYKYGSMIFFFGKQITFVVLSLFVMGISTRFNYQKLSKNRWPLFLILFSIILLAGLFVFGYEVNNALRWYNFLGIRFQPSEFAKLALIIYTAHFLSSRNEKLGELVSGILPLLLVIASLFILIMFQPDLSTAMVTGVIIASMMFISRMKFKHILGIVASLIPFVIYLLKTKGYQISRVKAWLKAWENPADAEYQIRQSLIGLGQGGFIGQGIGNSKQKFSFLPESHTDFIFSIVGEEFGFIGTSIILILFLLIFIRGIRIANQTANPFGKFLAVGLTLNIVVFAFINAAVVTMLVPVTGLSMPFLSYGGSNLIFMGLSVGILQSIVRQNNTVNQNWDNYPQKRELLYHNLVSSKI
jgi:cell division protein FtsW